MKAATLSLPFLVLVVAAKVEFDPKSLAMLLSGKKVWKNKSRDFSWPFFQRSSI